MNGLIGAPAGAAGTQVHPPPTYGEVIADGAPDAVARDRRVVEAYLGQAYVQ